MARLTLQGIRKVYEGGSVAVHGVDLEVADGELVVLVGPSGCGKSTTLRMIAGLESITEGRLLIDGKLVNDLAPAQRDIAMVFQSYALYPHMSVRDNMRFALKIRKMSPADIEKRIMDAAQMLDMVPLLDRTPRQLSGGQRQRVAIGWRSCGSQRCSSSTNHSRISTPSSGSRRGARSRGCSAGSTSLRSTSRTTRPRR